jgi:serralysin
MTAPLGDGLTRQITARSVLGEAETMTRRKAWVPTGLVLVAMGSACGSSGSPVQGSGTGDASHAADGSRATTDGATRDGRPPSKVPDASSEAGPRKGADGSAAEAAADSSTPPGTTVKPGNGCQPGLGIDAGYYTCSREYFVSPGGSDSNDGTSMAKALKTIGAGTRLALEAGDCVTVADGTYDETVVVGTSGSADSCSGYVVFRAASQGGAKVVSTDQYTGFTVAASYVMVDGFDLQDTGTGSAFGAGTNTVVNGKVVVYHHIDAIRNVAHDSGGAGLGAIHADYIRFEENVVYNNSSRSDYGDSGIDLWEAQASDTLPGFHIVIRNNYSYLNEESDIPTNLQTDGEGIIVDSFDYADPTYGTTPYAQETLIENNVIWGNGGRGIEAAGAEPTSHVTIRNNTVYDNNRQLQEYAGAEIVSYGNANAIYNNIVIQGLDDENGTNGDVTYPLVDDCGTSGGGVVVSGGSIWANNLVFNAKTATALSYTSCLGGGANTIPAGSNLLGVDAKLVAETLPSATTPPVHDFAIAASSPAAHAGTASSAPAFDYDYVKRPATPSIGAFEP